MDGSVNNPRKMKISYPTLHLITCQQLLLLISSTKEMWTGGKNHTRVFYITICSVVEPGGGGCVSVAKAEEKKSRSGGVIERKRAEVRGSLT